MKDNCEKGDLMVNYHEGDPSLPGNATLNEAEIAAFEMGDAQKVKEAGIDYGQTCVDYAMKNGFANPEMIFGVRALMKQPKETMTSFRMGLPFLEGVQEGSLAKIRDAKGRIRLAEGLTALSEFGKRPEVRAVVTEQETTTFNKLMSTLQDINGTAK
jgi:hypothetical protein